MHCFPGFVHENVYQLCLLSDYIDHSTIMAAMDMLASCFETMAAMDMLTSCFAKYWWKPIQTFMACVSTSMYCFCVCKYMTILCMYS